MGSIDEETTANDSALETGAQLEFLEAQRKLLELHGVAAASRFLEVPVTGGRAHVLEAGDGPPVVMVSGGGTPGAMWAPLMGRLTGFRLFALDLPGFGLTDAARRWAGGMRRHLERFLLEALDALDLRRTAIVANSLGSLCTSWLALAHPERVASFVHIGCPALALSTSAPLPMRLLSVRPLGRLLTRLQRPSPKQVAELGRMVHEDPLEPELADLLLATERLPAFRRNFLATMHTLLRLRGARPESRLTDAELDRLAAPTQIFWGENDPFGAVEVGRELAAALPAAELHVVGGGHAPWLRHSEAIAPVAARFLLQHA